MFGSTVPETNESVETVGPVYLYSVLLLSVCVCVCVCERECEFCVSAPALPIQGHNIAAKFKHGHCLLSHSRTFYLQSLSLKCDLTKVKRKY